MVKLLIIADDFTGALDTGIQFAKKGIETQVVADIKIENITVSETAQVLVVDLETRPLTREASYQAVASLTRWAIDNNISAIYKKTDSALRGNIGAELRAVADTAQQNLYFIPAFPEMNRVTVCGRHYIEGIPLQESAFGKDPFEPVRFSYIPDIIGAEERSPVLCVRTEEGAESYLNWNQRGIVIFDIQTDEDIKNRTKELKACNQLKYLAGCAGFASFLPEALELCGSKVRSYEKKAGMYVACGSLNPITQRQVEYARKNGFAEINLEAEQKLNPKYYETVRGKRFLEELGQKCRQNNRIIIDTFDRSSQEVILYTDKMGMSKDDIRFSVARCHGIILRYLLEQGMDYTLFMTGGDTLMGFMKILENPELCPICEVSQGVVLSKLKWKGNNLQVISKSGGFGKESILVEIAEMLIIDKNDREDDYEICNDPGCVSGRADSA